MKTFFTADTHFLHKNILKFEKRPYDSVEEMTSLMIEKWNDQVSSEDIVYHLGDFCLSNVENTIDILKQLNGKIILIKGNHDFSKHYKKINKLGLLHGYYEIGTSIKYNKQQLFLSHYPLELGIRLGKWSIHGHIHSYESTWDNQINVGVDSPHFKNKPFGELITIDELFEEVEKRQSIIKHKYEKLQKERSRLE